MVRHVVAVCTARRLSVLEGTLPRIAQHMAHGLLLVVDNGDGSDSSAIRRLLESIRAQRPQLQYAATHEPVPGIARARNCALEAARGADVLTFLDDDVVPQGDDWQARVLEAITAHPDVGMVGGPVTAVLGRARPWWWSPAIEPCFSVVDTSGLDGFCQAAWLAGDNLSYRLHAIGNLRFCAGLGWNHQQRGAIGGEDTAFSQALERCGWRAWFARGAPEQGQQARGTRRPGSHSIVVATMPPPPFSPEP